MFSDSSLIIESYKTLYVNDNPTSTKEDVSYTFDQSNLKYSSIYEEENPPVVVFGSFNDYVGDSYFKVIQSESNNEFTVPVSLMEDGYLSMNEYIFYLTLIKDVNKIISNSDDKTIYLKLTATRDNDIRVQNYKIELISEITKYEFIYSPTYLSSTNPQNYSLEFTGYIISSSQEVPLNIFTTINYNIYNRFAFKGAEVFCYI